MYGYVLCLVIGVLNMLTRYTVTCERCTRTYVNFYKYDNLGRYLLKTYWICQSRFSCARCYNEDTAHET